MNLYNDSANVEQYIKMCDGYDGRNLYEALSKHLDEKSTLLELLIWTPNLNSETWGRSYPFTY